jgi:hypothetical protein
MRPGARSTLKTAGGLLLAAVFLALAFRTTSLQEVAGALAAARPEVLLAMFALLILSHLLRAYRWRYFLAPLHPSPRLRNLFSAVMVGYMMNNVLPRAGEIVRPYAISTLEGIRFPGALGTIVIERLMDMVLFLLLLVAIPLVYAGPLAEAFPWIERGGLVLAAASIALLGGIAALMVRRDWTDRLLRVVERVLPGRFAARLHRAAHSFLDGAVFLSRPSALVPVLLLTLCIWGLYLAMIYTGFSLVPLGVPLGPDAALVVLAISSIGVAIPTPGATGTWHFFTSEALIRLFAVAQGPALAYATATHLVGFLGVTAWGLYFFLRDHIRLTDAVAARKDT